MIELHTWTTPSGLEAIIMLEEVGLDYRIIPVNLGAGEQHKPGYRMLSPTEKVPALVDPAATGGQLTLFEPTAILLYLAEKTGQLLPTRGNERYLALEWLMVQASEVTPVLCQADHFVNAEHEHGYAEDRFVGEAQRLHRLVDERLSAAHYLAGDYSIADVAMFPWLRDPSAIDLDLSAYPNVARWLERVESRDAVRRALAVQVVAPEPAGEQ